MSSIFLLIANPAVAQDLRGQIEATPGLEVSGSAASLAEVRRDMPGRRADLLLADLDLPDGCLSELLLEMRSSLRYTRLASLVVALSLDELQLLEALHCGADNYIVHGQFRPRMIAAIQLTLAGGAEMAPAIARQLRAHFESHQPRQPGGPGAPHVCVHPTERERQLLHYLADGFLPHEVARKLRITAQEVALGIRQLYRKLQRHRVISWP